MFETVSDTIRELHQAASSVPRSGSIVVPAGQVLDLVNAFWQAVRIAEDRRRELGPPLPLDDRESAFVAELQAKRRYLAGARS